jgi:pimeloyl-ACP methyl ester carboxylesterase
MRGPAGGTRAAGSWGRGLAGVLAGRLRCSGPSGSAPPDLPTAAELRVGVRPPAAPNDNVVIAVAGIGSSTWPLGSGSFGSDAAMYQLDLRTLGYAGNRIFHFSYRGVPEQDRESPATPYRFHLPYGRDDTFQPIAASAALLDQLVERVHAAHPGRRIDIVAHSQGGIVAQYYLERLHDRQRSGGPDIDHLVTIASPHSGADLAGLAARLGAAGTSSTDRRALDRLAGALGAPPPSSPAAGDLAVGSSMMTDLARRWTAKVKTTTIAAGLDLVVPAQRTRLPGAAHYTVDLPGGWSSLWAHTAIVGAERTKQIVYGALSDHPAPCTPLQDAMADYVSGPLVSAMADGLLDALTEVAAP